MTNQSNALYAAIYAADFPLQAIIRLSQDLRDLAVAILDGIAPQERVCALNFHATKRGVVPGMTRLEIEELGEIHILSRSVETEHAASLILLETLSQFSPRIEETFAANAIGYVLDISGTERLFGSPAILAKRIQKAIHAAGFRATVAVSHNFDTARIKAAFSRGITIVPQRQESASLGTIPIAALQLEEEHYETFALWGIHSLGELAELPEDELITRLGQRAKHWLKLARGVEEHVFVPIEAKFELKEYFEFETHIEQLDSLVFIASSMISNLVARSTSRALSLASLAVQMDLEKDLKYQRVIRPAIPTSDRRFLLKLLQLEIAAHPPQAAICSLTLMAEAGPQSKLQLGLFAPQSPEPSRLDVTIARLKALVGNDHVGSPRLLDTHSGDSFVMESFSVSGQTIAIAEIKARVSLRRMRPQRQIRMHLENAKPVYFHYGANRYDVQICCGPWIASGNWWAVNPWDLEEWDIVATDRLGESIGYLIVHDHCKKQWLLDAQYD